MSLIAVIDRSRVELTEESNITGYEGFVLVWSEDCLKVYKEAI